MSSPSASSQSWRRLWRFDALDRRIMLIAVPALGSLLVEPIYVLTDTAVVGRLCTVPLGGLALASTVLNPLLWVSIGTASCRARVCLFVYFFVVAFSLQKLQLFFFFF